MALDDRTELAILDKVLDHVRRGAGWDDDARDLRARILNAIDRAPERIVVWDEVAGAHTLVVPAAPGWFIVEARRVGPPTVTACIRHVDAHERFASGAWRRVAVP